MPARLLSLDTLSLDQAVVEFKHPPAYLLWDRAGELWYSLCKRWPALERIDAQPNVTRFKLPPADELAVEIDRHYFSSSNPARSFDAFEDIAEAFSADVLAVLAPQIFQRVGLRLIYSLQCKDREEASSLAFATGLFSRPSSLDKERPFGGRWLVPDIGFRWEGKAVGLTYRLRVEEKKYQITLPPGFPTKSSVKSFNEESISVSVDIDYYTTVVVPRGQMMTKRWINSGYNVIRTEIVRLLEKKE